ncbi:DNA-binding protein [Pseudomonas sp. GZD-209]|uniref:DNA-binding protein n=1 Tax=Pseudomonas sp. GZD-209 TaxID=3404807 RepID=UPI003BB556B7
MARPGINRALVQRARDALLARGLTPSIEAVRAELGHTGSKTTINRYLQELAAAEPRPPSIDLSRELQALIESLAQRLASEAQETVAADRARLDRQQMAYQQQRAVESARFEQLQIAHHAQGDEYRALLQREQQLNSQLQKTEGKRQRLDEACRQQLTLLEERQAHIQSLEAKHQQARDALSHYREQHVAQRQEELQRHDEQVRHLQTEVRGLREQLLQRQEEVTQLYRELERMTSDRSHQQEHVRRCERELLEGRQQLSGRDEELKLARRQGEAAVHALALQREKTKQYLQSHRQDQRVIRTQAKQLTRLQALLSPASSNPHA